MIRVHTFILFFHASLTITSYTALCCQIKNTLDTIKQDYPISNPQAGLQYWALFAITVLVKSCAHLDRIFSSIPLRREVDFESC